MSLSAACTTTTFDADYYAARQAESEAQLARVSLSDGVSRTEAEALAGHLFDYHTGIGCGMLGAMTETTSAWRFATLVGVGAAHGDDIIVSKIDGTLSWGDEVFVLDPVTSRKLVRKD